jgi:hypothetical protein
MPSVEFIHPSHNKMERNSTQHIQTTTIFTHDMRRCLVSPHTTNTTKVPIVRIICRDRRPESVEWEKSLSLSLSLSLPTNTFFKMLPTRTLLVGFVRFWVLPFSSSTEKSDTDKHRIFAGREDCSIQNTHWCVGTCGSTTMSTMSARWMVRLMLQMMWTDGRRERYSSSCRRSLFVACPSYVSASSSWRFRLRSVMNVPS